MRHATVAALLLAALAVTGAARAEDEGKVLYETKCAMCHGKDGVAKPAGKGSRDFNDPAFQAASSAETIAKVTAEGRAKMPSYKTKLSPEQIRMVAGHVKTLGPSK